MVAANVLRVSIVFLLLCGSAHVAARFTRKKQKAFTSSRANKDQSHAKGKVYGDRKPWEERQEGYDWEFPEVGVGDLCHPTSIGPGWLIHRVTSFSGLLCLPSECSVVPLSQADFFTKIRNTWDNNYVGSPEEAFEKPLCGTLNATKETTYYGKWWVAR